MSRSGSPPGVGLSSWGSCPAQQLSPSPTYRKWQLEQQGCERRERQAHKSAGRASLPVQVWLSWTGRGRWGWGRQMPSAPRGLLKSLPGQAARASAERPCFLPPPASHPPVLPVLGTHPRGACRLSPQASLCLYSFSSFLLFLFSFPLPLTSSLSLSLHLSLPYHLPIFLPSFILPPLLISVFLSVSLSPFFFCQPLGCSHFLFLLLKCPFPPQPSGSGSHSRH